VASSSLYNLARHLQADRRPVPANNPQFSLSVLSVGDELRCCRTPADATSGENKLAYTPFAFQHPTLRDLDGSRVGITLRVVFSVDWRRRGFGFATDLASHWDTEFVSETV